MKKKDSKYFYLCLAIFTFLIFFLNSEHLNQQGTYQDIFKPIADNIITKGQYTCESLGNTPLMYPLWGYTFLVTVNSIFSTSDSIILFIQFLLCVSAISIFYRLYQIEARYWHIPFFLPFIALMSVKWPDAIVSALLVYFIYFAVKAINDNRIRFYIYSGLILGIILNFRSEYLYLLLLMLLFLLLPQSKGKRKELFKLIMINFILSIILLLPWALRSKNITDEYHFSSTNGGAVMYISLGQLPGNRWNIIPFDETAYEIAKMKGFASPYSVEADKYFKEQSKRLICEYPGEYARKSVYNFLSAWIRGVYTGEYANFFIEQDRRKEIDREIMPEKGIMDKIKIILKLDFSESLPLLLEKSLQGIFIPIFFFAIIINLLLFFKIKNNYLKILLLVTIILIFYKFAIISFIQYEYRHMNTIYLFILGGGLSYMGGGLSYIRIRKKKNNIDYVH
jgi:hypothetical protein